MRTGRPKKENTKDLYLKIRITDSEDEFLTNLCKATKKTRTDICREALGQYFEENYNKLTVVCPFKMSITCSNPYKCDKCGWNPSVMEMINRRKKK